MTPAALLALDGPGMPCEPGAPRLLTVADMCLLEPALFKASWAMAPAASALLQWPALDWFETEQAERLAAS
jgi:hypothetical protein